jgi:hypothetical protein
MNPHLTLTLSPPIRMGAEREQQIGTIDHIETYQQSPVQGFNARFSQELWGRAVPTPKCKTPSV